MVTYGYDIARNSSKSGMGGISWMPLRYNFIVNSCNIILSQYNALEISQSKLNHANLIKGYTFTFGKKRCIMQNGR